MFVCWNLSRDNLSRETGRTTRLHRRSARCKILRMISIHSTIQVSVKRKHSTGEKHMWEDKLTECRIRGWRAVSAADLHGKGPPKRSVCIAQTQVVTRILKMRLWLYNYVIIIMTILIIMINKVCMSIYIYIYIYIHIHIHIYVYTCIYRFARGHVAVVVVIDFLADPLPGLL